MNFTLLITIRIYRFLEFPNGARKYSASRSSPLFQKRKEEIKKEEKNTKDITELSPGYELQ